MDGFNKVVEIVIPRPPSMNRLWRMGGGRMYKSAEYNSWLIECMALASEKKFPSVLGKYKLSIRIARPDKRRRDIDNYIKAISDFLQHAKIIQDDYLCEAVYCRWVEEGPDVRINVYSVGRKNELPQGTTGTLQRSQAEDAKECHPPISPRDALAAAYAEIRRRGKPKRLS